MSRKLLWMLYRKSFGNRDASFLRRETLICELAHKRTPKEPVARQGKSSALVDEPGNPQQLLLLEWRGA